MNLICQPWKPKRRGLAEHRNAYGASCIVGRAISWSQSRKSGFSSRIFASAFRSNSYIGLSSSWRKKPHDCSIRSINGRLRLCSNLSISPFLMLSVACLSWSTITNLKRPSIFDSFSCHSWSAKKKTSSLSEWRSSRTVASEAQTFFGIKVNKWLRWINDLTKDSKGYTRQ